METGERIKKILWNTIRLAPILGTIAFNFVNVIMNNLSDVEWRNQATDVLTTEGRIFFVVWVISSLCFFIPEIIKNHEENKTAKKSKMSSNMLASISRIRRQTLTNLISHLDRNYENKSYGKTLSKSRAQLKEMLGEIEKEVLFYFNKTTETSSIKAITSLSYRIPSLNEGKWKLIGFRGTRRFNPQKVYDNENSTFYNATNRNERLIFYATKRQALDEECYIRSDDEMGQKNPKGSILCCGFEVISDKHEENEEKITYIEAVLSMSTKRRVLTTKKRKKDRERIKDYLELIIFDNYIEKMQIELINLFIQENQENRKNTRSRNVRRGKGNKNK